MADVTFLAATSGGRTWVVDPKGQVGVNVAGSLQDPWSFDYAASGADGRIGPGDTVILRGGVYRSVEGIRISFSGQAGLPVRWAPAPGEVFEADGAIPEFVDTPIMAWEPFEIAPGHHLYRSTNLQPTAFMYGGYIEIDGQWLPLATHKNLDWIRADIHTFQAEAPYYLGPGVLYNTADQHIYGRLDNSTREAQCGRDVAQIGDPDPRNHALRISPADRVGLTIAGSHHVLEGFTAINNYYGAFVLEGAVVDVTFLGIGGRVVYFGARLGTANGIVITQPEFDGGMDPEKWWVAWSDVKGAQTPADHNRKCGLDYGVSQNVVVSRGYFHDFFDSALSEGAHHINVHDVEFRTWDDAWQMPGSLHHIEQHHNLYIGAGPSRDGASTDRENLDAGTLWIHDNVIDTTRYRLFYFRFGRPEDPSGIGWREPIPLSAHNQPEGNRWAMPLKFYYNTVVTGIPDLPINSDVGVGQFGTVDANLSAVHEVYNNIFLVSNGRPLGRDTWVNTGAEIYDGNVYWGWPDPSAPSRTSIWRFLQRSAGVVDGENPARSIDDVKKIRDLAFADSHLYYPPGWERSGLSVDPKLTPDYRPQNLLVGDGAVNLTATGWPGTGVHRRWRGAVTP